ncbi:hypothetical protein BU17DRAFT_60440 [Hysterangium stoloniferum]|nr:hypothetical protein BU17DRAFT_60440 [Hysterangium stoloniferum]
MSSVGFQEQRLDAHRSSDGFKRAIEDCQGQSSVSRIVFEEKQLGVMNFSERVLDRHGIHNWMEGPSPRYSDTTCMGIGQHAHMGTWACLKGNVFTVGSQDGRRLAGILEGELRQDEMKGKGGVRSDTSRHQKGNAKWLCPVMSRASIREP